MIPTAPSGNVWSTAEKRKAARAGYGPYPKPNVCPVPHRLATLARTRHGYPVPWVSTWTGTHDPAIKPLWQPVPGHPEWGDYDASEEGMGEGHPLAGMLHIGRQVRGMTLRLCGVCGKHINGKVILIGGPSVLHTGFHEPPVHRECARYGIQACPGINHGRCVVVETRDYDLKPLWGAGGYDVHQERPLFPTPVVAVAAFAAGDAVVWTTKGWAAYTKTDPHPVLAGFPDWDLNDLSTHPDAKEEA